MKAHIFLVANPKFQLQILCSFGDMTKNVKFIGIPENTFLCIFIIIASIPRGAYFLLPLESYQEATSGWKFTTCISEVKVNQSKVKNIHVEMSISTFNDRTQYWWADTYSQNSACFQFMSIINSSIITYHKLFKLCKFQVQLSLYTACASYPQNITSHLDDM